MTICSSEAMTGPVGVEESGRGYALGGVEGQTEAVGTVGSEREIGATGVGDLTNSSSVVIGVTESSSVGGGGVPSGLTAIFFFLPLDRVREEIGDGLELLLDHTMYDREQDLSSSVASRIFTLAAWQSPLMRVATSSYR
jgi:hypothetical protein